MLNFYNLSNLIKESKNFFPPTVKYNFVDYMTQISSNPDRICGVHEKDFSHELKPLTHDDMLRYAAPDYDSLPKEEIKDYGYVPFTRKSLGNQLTDEEFKKFTGMTW